MTMNQQCGLKLLEISVGWASSVIQAKAAAKSGSMSETELKNLFSACVDMVREKFEAFPCAEDINEKFATVSEMHKVFADKFAEIDGKLAALPYSNRPSRRPV